MKLAAFLLVTLFGSCWCTKKDLKTIFAENKGCCQRWKIEPTPKSNNVNKLLHWAIDGGMDSLVEEIIGASEQLIEDTKKLYAAIRAEEKGIEKLKALLEKGANPNGFAPTYSGSDHITPLRLAWVRYSNCKTDEDFKKVYKLLKKKSMEKNTPAEVAQKIDNRDAVRLLLEHGALDPWGSFCYYLTGYFPERWDP